MPLDVEAAIKQIRTEMLQKLTPEEREKVAETLTPEERVQGLPTEERLKGVPMEELEAYLKKLKGESGDDAK